MLAHKNKIAIRWLFCKLSRGDDAADRYARQVRLAADSSVRRELICSRATTSSVDQFGGHHQHYRNFQPERLSGLAVDDEFEPGRLLDRQVGRLGALEDVAGVDADLTIHVRGVGS